MSEAKTTEDFEQVRKDFDEKVRNSNTNQNPIPWYVSQGRYFMGFGRNVPLNVKVDK